MNRTVVCGGEPSRPTRFKELGYRHDGPGLWRIIDRDTEASGGAPKGAVGPHYRTKTELLADLDRYAKAYGCAG